MKSSNHVVRLLKAIYLEVISIALILIGYVISGGENNGVSTFLFLLGVLMFFAGVFTGIGAFISVKEVDKGNDI